MFFCYPKIPVSFLKAVAFSEPVVFVWFSQDVLPLFSLLLVDSFPFDLQLTMEVVWIDLETLQFLSP
jgi:hypothetical protein